MRKTLDKLRLAFQDLTLMVREELDYLYDVYRGKYDQEDISFLESFYGLDEINQNIRRNHPGLRRQ